eukprot:7457588-Karenia_brevis.AAC.1
MKKYRRILAQLSLQGVAFKPLVWSTEGAPHPVVLRVMAHVAEQAARRNGITNSKHMYCRWLHEIGCAIQERKAAMIAACFPRRKAREAWLLTGDTQWDAIRMQ